MIKRTKTTLGTVLDWAVYSVFAAAAAGIVVLIIHTVPAAFDFGQNFYALISAAGFITNLILLVMLLRRPTHATSLLWFALFIIFNLLWGVFEFMQRLTTSPAGDLFWSHIIFAVTSNLPAVYYLFVRSYTNRGKTDGSVITPALLIGTGTLISLLISADNVFPPPLESERQVWGYPPPTTLIAIIFALWVAAIAVLGIIRLVIHYRQATTSKARRQTGVLIFGTALLSFLGSGSIFFPIIHFNLLPPLGVLANAVLAGSVIYTIYKYDIFTVNMPLVADAVLATMAEAVIVTDHRYRILFANHTAERLLETRGHSVIDQDLSGLAGGRLLEHRREWEPRLLNHLDSDIFEVSLGTPDQPVILNLHVSPVAEAEQGFVFVLSDVTKLKTYSDEAIHQAKELEEANRHLERSQAALMDLLEESRHLQVQLKHEKAGVERKVIEATAESRAERARLEASISSLNLGFIMANVDGSFLAINREAQAMIARSVGLKHSFLPNIDLKIFETILAREFNLRTMIKHCLATGKPIKEDNTQFRDSVITLFLAPIIDHESKHERALGVTILLEDVTDAVALQRSRDEFFSIASHELRTPLTAIRGNTQMMQDYYPKAFKNPELKGMLSDIHDSSVRLITIVNDFLDTSRLEQGKIKFNLTALDATELIAEVVHEFESAGTSPHLYLKLDKPTQVPKVMADRDRLKQVLINLVGNALKFTEKGGVTISCIVQPKFLIISIIDTGKGIPVGSQHLLFRKFQQASDNILTRDSTRSTGLGLYICRLIMEAMKGTIELEHSEEGKGATFVLSIPFAKSRR